MKDKVINGILVTIVVIFSVLFALMMVASIIADLQFRSSL